MKNLFLVFVAILFLTPFTFAQTGIVKLGVTDLLNNTVNLEYEHELTPTSSVVGEVSFRLPTKVPGIVTNLFVGESTIRDINLFSSKLNVFALEGSYRKYTGKVPQGFYYAPFVKLSVYNFDMTGEYDNQDDGFYDVPASVMGSLTTFTTGIQLGTQWKVGDNLTINWNFFGLGLGILTGNATFTSDNTTEFNQWKGDVEKFLEEDVPFGNFDEKINIVSDPANKVMTADGTIAFPAVRMSLSVGYIIQ